MRLVRLKLRGGCPFWNLSPIKLTQENPISPMINIDLLSEPQVELINKSYKYGEIAILGQDGIVVAGNLHTVNIVEGNYVSNDDVEEDLDTIPEIVSITIGEDGECEKLEEEFVEPEGPTDEDFDEAKILLNRNGNTAMKVIRTLEQSDKNLMLLHACLVVENENKSRSGVVHTIQQTISGY